MTLLGGFIALVASSFAVGMAIAGLISMSEGNSILRGFGNFLNENWSQTLAITSIVAIATIGIQTISYAISNASVDDTIIMDITGSGKHGSYDISFKSGKHYIGKGSQKRMWTSATEKASLYEDVTVAVKWRPAVSNRTAFIQEAQWMQAASKTGIPLYNKIASPGFKYMGEIWIH